MICKDRTESIFSEHLNKSDFELGESHDDESGFIIDPATRRILSNRHKSKKTLNRSHELKNSHIVK